MKIITFTKNNQFQALLQFSDPVNAQQAKLVGDLPPCVEIYPLCNNFVFMYEPELVNLKSVKYFCVN